MLTFLKSVKKEMQLVTWPTYRQNCYSVGLVIIFSIFFAGFLGVADYLLSSLTNLI